MYMYYIFNEYDNRWLSISGFGVPGFRTKKEQQEFIRLFYTMYFEDSSGIQIEPRLRIIRENVRIIHMMDKIYDHPPTYQTFLF